jgi:peroxiredoxin
MDLNGRTAALVGALFIMAGIVLFALSKRATAPTAPSQSVNADHSAPIAAGEKAANFSLKDLDGKTVTLSSLRGKVVFLNIWATWCPPCRDEMPSMETLYDEFKSNKDFVMIAVSQDTKGKAAVLPYVEKNGYHFEVLLDPDNKVAEAYNCSGVPETFIIDRKGRIVAHHIGAFDWSQPDIKEALRELLDSKEG